VCAIVASVAIANAQPTEAVKRADALFNEGRALVDAGKFSEACPRFEESQRLDPGLGTLLNLAACYESVGRLASALTAFRSAEEQARAAGPGEKKREQAAADRARSLESRVARLTIIVAAGERPSGFLVTRDGVPVPALDFGRRIAVDPGTVVIEATATGFESFRAEVMVDVATGTQVVDIPALAPRNGGEDRGGGGDGGGGDGGGPVGGDTGGGSGGRKTFALVAVGGGVALLGAGVALGFTAKGKYDDVACTAGDGPPTGCSPAELDAIDSARTRGNLGTIVGGVGVVAIVAGAVLYLTAPAQRAVAVSPVVSDREVGVAFSGRF
jgi:serine/threonine-protein kinase